jgi:hypothetical protein
MWSTWICSVVGPSLARGIMNIQVIIILAKMGDLTVSTKDRIVKRSARVCNVAESCTFKSN